MSVSSFREGAVEGFLVVTYDVVDDSRRARVANLLEDFGTRVQYSVFTCVLGSVDRERLTELLSTRIDPVEDSVLFFRVCKACQGRAFHLGRDPPDPDPQLLIL